MRGADANEGLPAATLDGACAPPSFSAQTHAQRHAPHARAALNPHPPAAVQEMSDLLDADLGRPALEVLTRLCDQGVRPVGVPVRDARTANRALAG